MTATFFHDDWQFMAFLPLSAWLVFRHLKHFICLCFRIFECILTLESKIRSKYFQKWKAKFCLILERSDSMRNPSATAFSGQVFELPKNPLNAVGTVFINFKIFSEMRFSLQKRNLDNFVCNELLTLRDKYKILVDFRYLIPEWSLG